MTCGRCGKEIREDSVYCSHCGQKVDLQTQGRLAVGSEEDYRAFLGPRADNYLVKFKKFTNKEEEGFALTWNWPAFFFGFWWLLYRKLYVWALVALALWLIPHLALPVWFIWGAVANYLYYLQAKRKISDFRNRSSTALPAVTLAEIGGVNRWVWVLAVLLAVIIGVAIILGGVFLYQLFREFLNWPEYLEV
jgi:hypothetical protein